LANVIVHDSATGSPVLTAGVDTMRRILPLTALFLIGCGAGDVASLRPEDVDRIEVAPLGWDERQPEPPAVRTTDPAAIKAVLEALRPAGEAPMHKCGPRGQLVVVKRSGRRVVLWLLPGHDERYYEYGGQGKALRVDRERFQAAMKLLGADWVPRECR
jgi:hypothetical protein